MKADGRDYIVVRSSCGVIIEVSADPHRSSGQIANQRRHQLFEPIGIDKWHLRISGRCAAASDCGQMTFAKQPFGTAVFDAQRKVGRAGAVHPQDKSIAEIAGIM